MMANRSMRFMGLLMNLNLLGQMASLTRYSREKNTTTKLSMRSMM